MNKFLFFILLVILCFSCNGCNQDAEYVLPTFKPLDNTADIVLIENSKMKLFETEIIAIDTKTSKVRQIYNFGHFTFRNPFGVTNNNTVYFSVNFGFLYLDTLDGTCGKIYSAPVNKINVYEESVCFSDDYDNRQSYFYDNVTKKLTQFDSFGAISSKVININNNLYSVYYVGTSEEFGDADRIIANITTDTPINLSYKYTPFEIHGGKYLVSEAAEGGFALHEIISFEPENLKFITEIRGFIDDIADDDDFIYIGGTRGYVKIIRKSDNQIIARAKDLPEIEGGGFTVIKNGYAWLGAGQDSGDFIRVDLTDDDGDGVLKWELIKYR